MSIVHQKLFALADLESEGASMLGPMVNRHAMISMTESHHPTRLVTARLIIMIIDDLSRSHLFAALSIDRVEHHQ